MKKIISVVAFAVFCAAVALLCRTPEKPSVSVIPEDRLHSPPPSQHQAHTVSSVDADSSKASVLGIDEFCSRFELNSHEAELVNWAMYAFHARLTEEKGQFAKVEIINSGQISVSIPSIGMDDRFWSDSLAKCLSPIIGADRSNLILSDPSGRETLFQWVHRTYLASEEVMLFTRTSLGDEANADFPTFSVKIQRRDAEGNPLTYGVSSIEGFRYVQAGLPGKISWTAMAKAPVGYFRKQPIRGVEDRPESQEIISKRNDTNEVTVLTDMMGPK